VLEDEVKVTAVRAPVASLSEAELCLWLADKVPYFAVPRYIEFRADLPRNDAGRVLKYQLRDEGCTPTTWDREAVGLSIERR
jgi:crotonobetaine/carnitine-CoA ligase